MGKYFSNLGGEEASLNISCKQKTRPIEGLAAKVKIYTVREVTSIVMALERYFVNFSLTCKKKILIIQRVMRKTEMPQRRIWKDTDWEGWVVSIDVDRDLSSLKPQEWNQSKAGRSFQHTA